MPLTLTKTILVVEDTVSEMELLSHYLDEAGYTVIGTASAKDGLNIAIAQQPDVIVTDVVMPEMSGFELCRSLKRHPATQKIPIIICSSKDQEIDRLWGMKQGANAYITKPFGREQLLKTVDSVAAN
jgi:two-component system, chemotaxis family, response regulator PixH